MISIDPTMYPYGNGFETKHLWMVDDDNTVREVDLLFQKGSNGTWCGENLTWKVIGTDLFDNERSAQKESLRRIGPKFAEGTWVEQSIARWDGSTEKKHFQVDRNRQGFITGKWFYHMVGDPTDDFNGPEENLTAIAAPTFEVGDYLVWQGFGDGSSKYAPGKVTNRSYAYGRWEYTTDKLMSFYTERSFTKVAKPTYEVGDYASCCGDDGAEVTERKYDHDVQGWRYTLAGGRSYRHGEFCLTAAAKPTPKAEKASLGRTPRFQVGQRVQWEYSWMSEAGHGIVTLVMIDDDGDLHYGVTPDGEDFTDEDSRYDFYDRPDGTTDSSLVAEKEETAVSPF